MKGIPRLTSFSKIPLLKHLIIMWDLKISIEWSIVFAIECFDYDWTDNHSQWKT